VGQVSRIHNHREQNCWMVTPIGRLRVQISAWKIATLRMAPQTHSTDSMT
jgi:hypothetical protein